MQMKEAMFWEKETGDTIRCGLCYQYCLIQPGARGLCGVRENRDGRLVSLVYGRPVATAVDPIEKKPLYHFLPGSKALSIGTAGCNFRCLNCQNCTISQLPPGGKIAGPDRIGPEQIVTMAKAEGCRSIAYTYTEPTIFYEYAYDIARPARDAGLKNLFVTNGYIMPKPLREIAPWLDAANIDLKFFRDELYLKVAGARLKPVLDTIRLYYELGLWIEITTLVIPGYNDDTAQLRDMAEFIAGMNTAVPWHLSSFYPTYKLTDAEPTPRSTLEKAEEIGRNAGLEYVYLGNVAGPADTVCPKCGKTVVERRGMGTRAVHINGTNCPDCGTQIGGVWA
jgi:pyruvate formate lyase activating enzyme